VTPRSSNGWSTGIHALDSTELEVRAMSAWLGLLLLIAAIGLMLVALLRQARVVSNLHDEVDQLVRSLPRAGPTEERPRLFRALFTTAEQPVPASLSDPAQRLLAIAAVLAVVGTLLNRPAGASRPDPEQVAQLAAMQAAQDSLTAVVASLRDSVRTVQLAATARTPREDARGVRTKPTRRTPQPPARPARQGAPALPSLPTVAPPAAQP
jgi:hypothetical protein